VATKAPRVAPKAAKVLPPSEGHSGAAAKPDASFTHFRVGERNVKRILIEDEQVWVGTSGGVIRYRPGSDEYKLYDGRSGLKVSDVIFVGKVRGQIVAGMLGGGLAVMDAASGQWSHYNAGEAQLPGSVHDVLQTKNGDVWIATRAGAARVRGGAFRQPESWSRFTAAGTGQGLPSDHVYALAEGRDGEIWFATEAGVAVLRNGTWRRWQSQELGLVPAAPTPAAHGSASAAHGGAGMAKGAFVVAVAVDRLGAVWAGTLGAGLLRYDGDKWRSYTVADGLPGNHVFALHQDALNRLWVGTNNGLARLQDGKFAVMTTQDGLYSNTVFTMASAANTLWVGSYGGVARIRSTQ
jgi:ligand-binding sensor domain-containing protein